MRNKNEKSKMREKNEKQEGKKKKEKKRKKEEKKGGTPHSILSKESCAF